MIHNWQSNGFHQFSLIQNSYYNFDLSVVNPIANLSVKIYDVDGVLIGDFVMHNQSSLTGEYVKLGKIETSDSTDYPISFSYTIKYDNNCARYKEKFNLINNTSQLSDGQVYYDSRQIRALNSGDTPNRSWALGSTDVPSRGWNLDSSDVPNRGWTLGTGDTPGRSWALGTGDSVGIIRTSTTNNGLTASLTTANTAQQFTATSTLVQHFQVRNTSTSDIIYIGSSTVQSIPLFPQGVFLWDANPNEATDISTWYFNAATAGDEISVNYQA